MSNSGWERIFPLAQKHFGTTDLKEVYKITEEEGREPLPVTVKEDPHFGTPGVDGIPTPEEVNQGHFVRRKEVGYHQNVVFVRNFAVKVAASPVLLEEAENYLFLQKLEISGLNIPKVYAVYSRTDFNVLEIRHPDAHKVPWHYMVTEKIEGQDFREAFEKASLEEQVKLCRKLGKQIQLLRSIAQPGATPYYGRVNGQPMGGNITMLTNFKSGDQVKRYDRYEELVSAMRMAAERSIVRRTNQFSYATWSPEFKDNFTAGMIADLYDFEYRLNRVPLRDRRPVLTHGELKNNDIIVRNDGEVFLLDFEKLHWLPAFIEYSGLKSYSCWDEKPLEALLDQLGPMDPLIVEYLQMLKHKGFFCTY